MLSIETINFLLEVGKVVPITLNPFDDKSAEAWRIAVTAKTELLQLKKELEAKKNEQ